MLLLSVPLPALVVSAPSTLTGDIRACSISGRTVLIRLPIGYDAPANRHRRYPVFYLQDGQNLFDGATAFIGGQEWRADETTQELEQRHEIEPVILVALYNAGADRANEYTPVRDEKYKTGGAAETYGKWLSDTVKPFVDSHYRTKTDPANTAIGGSSLGGLLVLHLTLTHPTIWGKAAVLSPSVWWANKAILSTVNALLAPPAVRLYVDTGTAEDDTGDALTNARALRDALLSKGWGENVNFTYREAPDAKHNEAAWAARFGDVLRFLFPVQK